MGELIISILGLIFFVFAKTRDKEKIKTKIDYRMLTRVVTYFREHNLSLDFLIAWAIAHKIYIMTLDPDVMIKAIYKSLDHKYYVLVTVGKASQLFVYNEEGRAFPVAEADLIVATERDRHYTKQARIASGGQV